MEGGDGHRGRTSGLAIMKIQGGIWQGGETSMIRYVEVEYSDAMYETIHPSTPMVLNSCALMRKALAPFPFLSPNQRAVPRPTTKKPQ
mmetsp:Transcript_14385/g.29446  ORF Transcript_14385/g.29446 Transcript_14385/m.29446 type:complete len:88 (+) Transcript_14385:1082-1345(+)